MEQFDETFRGKRVQDALMVSLHVFILMLFSLQDAYNQWCYLTVNFSRVCVAQLYEPVVQGILTHAKLSLLVVVCVGKVYYRQSFIRVQINSKLLPK